jgi:hypothetical protein
LSKALLSQPSHCISQLLFILAADFIERQSFNVPSHFSKLSQEIEVLSTRICSLEESDRSNSVHHEDFRSQLEELEHRIDNLSKDSIELRSDFSTLHPPVVESPLGSVILSDFPSIFEDFRSAQMKLLYRGTRDGFHSGDFYVHCSDRANTLTIVKTTRGFVFGGFTPLKWQNTDFRGLILEDKNHESFVFTLINPHGTEPMKFPLRPDSDDYAILVCSNWGPSFGGNGYGNSDFRIGDQCNGNAVSFTALGGSYDNTSGYDGSTFLVGERNFTVAEIEVFEILRE